MVWDTAGFGDRSGLDMLDEARGVGYGPRSPSCSPKS
jgi:hypothetical protein